MCQNTQYGKNKLIIKEPRQFDAQHLRQREITSTKIVLPETICFKRRTSQPFIQTADKGRTFKIPSSDHLSYCWREKILSLLQNFIISYLPLINNVQTHMHKNNTYVAADIRCFPKSPWNKMNNVFIAFTDESRVAAICNGW